MSLSLSSSSVSRVPDRGLSESHVSYIRCAFVVQSASFHHFSDASSVFGHKQKQTLVISCMFPSFQVQIFTQRSQREDRTVEVSFTLISIRNTLQPPSKQQAASLRRYCTFHLTLKQKHSSVFQELNHLHQVKYKIQETQKSSEGKTFKSCCIKPTTL